MREDEAGRSHTPWRWHLWFKRISNAATHLSAATLLAGVANGLAARKHKSRNDHHGRRDQANTDEDRGNERNRGDKSGNDSKEDRQLQQEQKLSSDGDGDGGKHNHGVKQERRVDESNDVHSAAKETPTPTPTPDTGGGGGGGGDGGGGGGGGEGANRAGNAGSGFFDNPLATKARRRANDFDNAGNDQDDDGTFVDVHPDGESVYATDSVSLTTGPDGLEIVTDNITYVAEPTPTPEPLLGLELPEREPGFPFGEDFPFGNATVVIAPTSAEPSDPGDTGTDTVSRAKFVPSQPEPSSDGGDNTMDFTS
jgi:hypothetical protein